MSIFNRLVHLGRRFYQRQDTPGSPKTPPADVAKDAARTVPSSSPFLRDPGLQDSGTNAPIDSSGLHRFGSDVPDPAAFGIDVRRYFYEGANAQAFGTFWSCWGGYITAHHVYAAQDHTVPDFITGDTQSGAGAVDACLMGCAHIPSRRPRAPKFEERIFVYGYPAGSHMLSARKARAYVKRNQGSSDYGVPTWNCRIDERPDGLDMSDGRSTYYEPVTTGMSGGLVIDAEGVPLGVLVGAGGPIDWDNDGDSDQSLEMVALCDIWDVFQTPARV